MPNTLAVMPNAIPDELKQLRQWVVWRYVLRDSKWTKPPYQVDGSPASSTEPATWTSFRQAWAAYEGGDFDGVGYVLTEDDPYTGLDPDNCVDRDTGEIAPWALEIVEALTLGYWELSPSGKGLRGIVRAKLPPGRRRIDSIELYDTERYLTLTGHTLNGTSSTIGDCQKEIASLHRRIFGEAESSEPTANGYRTGGLDASDQEVVKRAMTAKNGAKFLALWKGDTSSYDSQSEGDLGLCSLLYFWTTDVTRVDSLFRQSGLYDEKWERDDYRAATLAKACLGDVYQGTYQSDGARPATDGKSEVPLDDTRSSVSQLPSDSTLTDMGNAERFVREHSEDVRYAAVWKDDGWVEWDERRWVRDEKLHVAESAKRTVLNLYREAADIEDREIREKWLRHARISQNAGRIAAIIRLARSDPNVAIRPAEFNRDPWAFNVLNGTVDLKTGKLRHHERGDLITKLAPVEYDASAKCPQFTAFLDRIMNGNMKLINYLKRQSGYCLIGDTSEQAIWVFHGGGDNGKSTLMNLVAMIIGDYGAQPSIDTFLVHKNRPDTQTDLMALAGVRLAVSTELEFGNRLSEDLIKRASGGERITGRGVYEKTWSYQPEFKLVLVVNHLPTIRGADEAIWKRVKKVPFLVTFPKEEQDKALSRKLREERSGILAWMVEGCLEWQRYGLEEPDEVTQATAAYREEMDVLGDWMTECNIKIGPDLSAYASELYASYRDWCEGTKVTPVSQTVFGTMLQERGFVREKRSGKVIRHGMALGHKADKDG